MSIKMSPKLAKVITRLSRRGLNKHSRASVTKAARIVVKAIKSEITKPTMKDLKRTIGFKVRQKDGITNAKMGAAVGRAGGPLGDTDVLSSGMKVRSKKDRTGRKGVGISRSNVHWFFIGTEKRWTGSRKRWTGRRRHWLLGGGRIHKTTPTGGARKYTGRMRSQAPRAVVRGLRKTRAAARRKLNESLWTGILHEWMTYGV